MAVIDHITTNNSATYEIQDTVARTKSNNLESTNYTDIGGGFADGNTLLVKTDNGMKKGFLNNFANWILDKLATKVYNQLATSNKTMIGALNELNSKPSWRYNKSDDIIDISFSPESLGNGIAFGEYKQLLLRVDETGMRISGLNNSTGNWEIIWKK